MNDSDKPEKPAAAERLAMPEKARGVDAYEAQKAEEKAETERQEKEDTIRNLDLERLDTAIAEIQPELEARRQKFWHAFTAGLIGTVISITVFLLFRLEMPADEIYFAVTVFSLLGALLLFYVLNALYRYSTKKIFLSRLAEAAGLTWNKKGLFPVSDLEKHRIIPPYDQHEVIDGFAGVYRDIPISFQEITLTDLEPDPNNRHRTREYMVFGGLAVRIKLRRPLEAHTVVMPNNALQTFFRTKFSDFQRIKLVSNRFEKKYNVMGTDQVEGRVVLDPAFIERYLEAGDHLKSRWIEASFKDDEVVFIIERKRPLFDIGFLWTTVSTEHLNKTIRDIKTVLRLIDILKLNPQVGI